MLTRAGEVVPPAISRPELYRWKRSCKKQSSKPVFDRDNVEHWIKKVEEASEFAVSEVFCVKKTTPHRKRPTCPALDLESTDQLYDHDDAYGEAQELLSEWMSSKLMLELASEDEEDAGRAEIIPAQQPEFVRYGRFDDLYDHLEREAEDSKAQDFLQELLHKEVVDSGILESLVSDSDDKRKKQRDPRLTMELRHRQVKENRAKRQKELEKQRQERALKKSAMAQAQVLVQEEAKQKALRIRKEEEEIQREMVRLRRDMAERRRAMEQARQIEWRKKETEANRKVQEKTVTQQSLQKEEEERRRLEKEARIQEMLSRLYAENHRCLQTCFSAWFKLVLDRRVKMGKARALADWKLQLKAFRAWRDHTRARNLERETQKMELDLRDQNRKQQLAMESHHRRLLRSCFIEWQLWSRAEKEKRELEARKEETQRKMAALLEAASSARVPKDSATGNPAHPEQETAVGKVSENGAEEVPKLKEAPSQTQNTPKHAWQVTRKHAELTPEELDRFRRESARHQNGPQKRTPPHGEIYENRYAFQQQLIEEQRRQLQEQKEMILGLVENQRLIISKQECDRATALSAQLSSQGPRAQVVAGTGSDQGTERPLATNRMEAPSVFCRSARSENSVPSPSPSAASTARRRAGSLSAPHPAVRAMAERAAQRMERKREMEEMKRKREEERLAQLKAAEEQRLQKEAAEKAAELERRREEKRLQKQKEQEKQMRLQREQQLLEKAASHHEKMLRRFWGLEPWKKLVAESRLRTERAEQHRDSVIKRRCLLTWHGAARERAAEKISRAEGLWTSLLLRRSFRRWLKYKDYLLILEERAERHARLSLRRKVFLAWLESAQEEKMASWEKQRVAAEHSQRRVLLTAFRTWRKFPKLMRDQKQKEERLEQLRKRVSEILPDFKV
ncbi:coiled-coil domain-containing protein 191 [Spea bombifrons]|uniref:coiled-coil domain-containing protein 191 n=1 Tax=Spea bombifrons TaxID=233779 RepID=UPI00234B2F05|nr:coiled-coil domain-containing protein 191 [Spea bombifrons]